MKNRLPIRLVPLILAILTLSPAVPFATDSPAARIPERDASVQWTPVLEDHARGAGDQTVSSHHEKAPDLLRLECSHGGGNRVLWRLTFAEPFVSQNNVLILYLDTDNDPDSGRQDPWVRGTDRMLTLVNGNAGGFVKSDAGLGKRTKASIDGPVVVFEDDLDILAERIRNARGLIIQDGSSAGTGRAASAGTAAAEASPFDWAFRAFVLSHTVAAPNDKDMTEWVAATLPIDPAKPRPREEGAGEKIAARDLSVRGTPETGLEIFFTTPEPVMTRVEGMETDAHPPHPEFLQNHRISVPVSVAGSRQSGRIVLLDELFNETGRVEIDMDEQARPEPERKTVKRGNFEVFLDVDGESLEATAGRLSSIRWPVSGGIPFPRGHLLSPRNVRLLDPGGTEREIQTEVLSPWPDGSIRWLLVEFIAELPADAGARFTLEYGADVRGQMPEMKLDLRHFDHPWIEQIEWDGGGSQMEFPGNQGAAVERFGPVHVIRTFEGPYHSDAFSVPFGYRARVHTYPGLPFTKTEHTLRVTGNDEFSRLESLRVLFPPEVATGPWSRPKKVPQFHPSATKAAQITKGEKEVGTLAESRRETGDVPGFIEFGDKKERSIVAVRNFSENWPKAFVWENNLLAVDLFPKLATDEYSDRPEPREMLYYCFDSGYYRLRRGVEKTHEILVARPRFAGEKLPDAESLAYWLDHPPVLRANPDWIDSTEAAGHIAPREEGRFEKYEEYQREGFVRVAKRREDLGEYGFMNFGDWYGERGKNWGNLEYDLGHALWLEWLRGGGYEYVRRAEEAASHMGDIDVVHASPDAMNVGRMWGHAVGHTGGYYPDGSLGMENFALRGFWDHGHTWCEGMLHLYLATGSPRYRANGMLVADQLAKYATVNYRMGTERTAGWPIMALVAAYEFAGDPYYINGAKIVARAAIKEQDPERGVWSHKIGECKHDPPHYGGKPFMTGVLITALSRLHRNLPNETGEDRSFRDEVAHSIVKGSDWMVNETWVDGEDGGGFIYAQCSSFEGKVSHAGAWMACEGLAYATEISGNPIYLERGTEAVATALQSPPPGLGKGLAMVMRSLPHFLAALEEKGLTSIE
jgi:hypothetical protein